MQKRSNLLLVLCVFYITVATNVSAQTKSTVLLNKATDSAKYVFDVNQLPSKIIIPKNNVVLSLSVKKDTILGSLNNSQEQKLSIKKDNESNNIGTSSKITDTTKNLNIKLNLHDKLPSMTSDLILNTEFSKANIQNKIFFYSSLSNTKFFDLNKQPKLIVNYEITKEPCISNWEQANANAQHTNSINWKWEGDFNKTTLLSSNPYTLTNCLSDKTVIYKEKPIVFEKTQNGCQMSLLNYANTGKLWSINIVNPPSKYPVIDKQGRLYLFLENNTMMVINLDNQSIIKTVDLNSISFNSNSSSKINIKSINDNPTIGYDGTIYLPINNNNGRVGIVALSSFPHLKPRWFYNTTNTVSSIALSENEKLAFFIETDTNNIDKKSKLVVLNNSNGSITSTSNLILSSYTNDVNSYISPIVVQKVDNAKSNIYVLDGNKTAKKLFVFQIDHNIANNENSTIEILKPINTIESLKKDTSVNTGISQPVVTSTGNVFFIKDNVLSKFDTNSNTISPVNCSSYTFSNESVITSSATDQLFIQSNYEICYVNTQIKDFKVLKLNDESTSSVNNLYLTPNLGVYSLSNESCRKHQLYNFRSKYRSATEMSDFKNNTVYFQNAIKIKNNSNINNNTNTILIANWIYLSKGFSIKKGANVSFKIN